MTHVITRRRHAFTLTELIVVIVLIITIIAVILPSFTSIIASTERTLAVESVQSALRGGRAAALNSSADRDVAIVFFYEPGGRTTMATYVSAGTILDEPPQGVNIRPPLREVFVPLINAGPVRLPKDWMVRAFAPINTVDESWYEGRRYDSDANNWVFPETGFYDPEERNAGRARQTFFVRFQAGTGKVHTSPMTEVLILDPAPIDAAERIDIGGDLNRGTGDADLWKYPGDAEGYDDLGRFVQRALTDSQLDQDELVEILGDRSIDTILARPVAQLALYREKDFAADLGVRVNRLTETIYVEPIEQTDAEEPEFVSDEITATNIRRWMMGDTNLDGDVDDTGEVGDDAPLARLFAIDPYTARLIELEFTP